jgi:hypothetical protein
MQFRLFSKLSFEVPHPVALIESHCIQSDFYKNFDLIPLDERKPEHANKIGARINKEIFSSTKFKKAIEEIKNIKMLKRDNNLDKFLDNVDVNQRNDCIREFNEKVIQRLLGVDGLGLSKATKILHTLHPHIIPIIDNPLQKVYVQEINGQWTEGKPEIFIDYYDNLREGDNWKYLSEVHEEISRNNLGLTKVRVFDILWWSYLRAKRFEDIKFSSIQW